MSSITAPNTRDQPVAETLPPGVELPDGTFLTFEPHPACPCANPAAASATMWPEPGPGPC